MTTDPRLVTIEYPTVSYVSGPLLFVELTRRVPYGALVDVVAPGGEVRRGQVLEVDGARAVVQVFAGTQGLALEGTTVRFSGDVLRLGVGPSLLGRTFDGSGEPVDGGPPPLPETFRDVNGLPVNPAARANPTDMIQTGVSAIDGLNTLVRGQKLPIFSGFGLPADQLAVQVARQARTLGEGGEGFVVVFAAIGITHREASFFRAELEESGALERAVVFLNRAEDPSIERLLTPRLALTAAEYLGFERGLHVLVILTDMTNYCEALREVGTARDEVPGRRGYPGYMYTDLASLYERAGRIRGRPGSVTQLIILSMPDDDLTHPVPDLTGYITEGQIVLSRELHQRGVVPPIDVLPSLSRLMNAGIGKGRTREDHRPLADQLYACYARGRDLRRLVAVVGEGALSGEDRNYLDFADDLERRFVGQGEADRAVEETLDEGWDLLARFEPDELQRVHPDLLARYHRGGPGRRAPEGHG